MAANALAREELLSLRRQIAKIEGRLADRLELPVASLGEVRPTGRPDGEIELPALLLRRDGAAEAGLLPIGIEALDAPLGGGLPRAALTEIHGPQMRDAGAVSGFALGMAALAMRNGQAPLLWIGAGGMFAEAGVPYAPGIVARYGIEPSRLILSSVRRIEDALWLAEEAAALAALAFVVLEVPASPRKLDLTATRRLHRRAQLAGRPLFLLRHAGKPEPTAAPVRLNVAAAPAGEKALLSGTLAGSIGPPAITVTVSRSRNHLPASVTLEWSDDAHAWSRRNDAVLKRPPDSGDLAAVSAHRQDSPPALGPRVAHGGGRAA